LWPEKSNFVTSDEETKIYKFQIKYPERDEYEYELRMDLLGRMIKTTRKERHLTQEELGKIVGVNKSQISKLGLSR